MEPRIIGGLIGALFLFGLLIVAAFRMRGRAMRLYRARFTALGPGRLTEHADHLEYACSWRGRDWQLEMWAPVKLQRTSSLTRGESPRVVARLELARPAPFGLHVVPAGGLLVGASERLRYAEQPPSEGLRRILRVGATAPIPAEMIGLLARIDEVPMVDLEIEAAPDQRTLVCSKLYGARDLPAWLTAIGELADALERAA